MAKRQKTSPKQNGGPIGYEARLWQVADARMEVLERGSVTLSALRYSLLPELVSDQLRLGTAAEMPA